MPRLGQGRAASEQDGLTDSIDWREFALLALQFPSTQNHRVLKGAAAIPGVPLAFWAGNRRG